MRRDRAIAILKYNEAPLRSLGLQRLALFGSTARDDALIGSDVDIAVQFDRASRIDLFGFAAITDQLQTMLGQKVDIVTEPNRSKRMQAMIDRDRVNIF